MHLQPGPHRQNSGDGCCGIQGIQDFNGRLKAKQVELFFA